MKQTYLIGADIGTTRAKSYLFQTDGTLVASAFRDYPCTHTGQDRSEQNAEDWWTALAATVREILSGIDEPRNVLAICLSTQGGTVVPVGPDGSPLRPAIVWNDSRCAEEAKQLSRTCSPEYVRRKTGWSLGSALNALEILWLRNHEPEIFSRAHKFLSVPDYLSMKLTGCAVLDGSNAGINQLADIDAMHWDENILAGVGIGADRLGEIVHSGDIVGRLTPEAAKTLGLSEQAVLVAGGHDQYCAALGTGAVHDGDVFVATGTCWVVAGISAQPSMRFSRSRHTVRGLWGSLVSQEAGGACLEWFRSNLGPAEGKKIGYGELNGKLAQVNTGELLFYPFFTGATYPTERPELRASFCNLSLSHTRYHMARAIMEGVCDQVAWITESFGKASLQSVKMVGGATNSPLWVQIMADTAGIPVVVPRIADVGCIGAAILAGVATGAFSDYQEGILRLCRDARVVEPGANSAQYQEKFEAYKRGFRQIFGTAG